MTRSSSIDAAKAQRITCGSVAALVPSAASTDHNLCWRSIQIPPAPAWWVTRCGKGLMGRVGRLSSDPPGANVGPSLQDRAKAAAGSQFSPEDGQRAGLEGVTHAGWLVSRWLARLNLGPARGPRQGHARIQPGCTRPWTQQCRRGTPARRPRHCPVAVLLGFGGRRADDPGPDDRGSCSGEGISGWRAMNDRDVADDHDMPDRRSRCRTSRGPAVNAENDGAIAVLMMNLVGSALTDHRELSGRASQESSDAATRGSAPVSRSTEISMVP